MARRVLLVAVLLAVVAAVAWQTGVFGPAAEPVAEVGDDGAGPEAVAAPGAGEAAALAAGRVGPRATVAGKVVARTPPPATGAPRVTGRVVDATGAAVVGARVVTMSEHVTRAITLEDLGAEGVAAFDAVTGADGRFVVGVSPDAPSHGLVVLTAELATAYVPVVRAGDDVTVTVDAAGEVAGVVTDLAGEPVVGATVTWITFLDVWLVETVATSGAGGAYRLAPVPSMRARAARGVVVSAVHVEAPGFAPLDLAGTPPEPARTREQHLVLTRGQNVVGKVVDGETGTPVAGARVVAWGHDGAASVYRSSGATATTMTSRWSAPRLGETVTDAQGAFRLERVPCRGFHAAASTYWGNDGPQVGFVTALLDGACSTTGDLGLRDEGTTQEVVLKVFGAATLTGRVVGADGRPMAKVTVNAVTPGRDAGALPASLAGGDGPSAITTTGDDGVYRLVRVPVSRTKDDEVKVVGRVVVRTPQFARRWSEDGDGVVTVKVTVKARPGAPVAVPDLVVKPPRARPRRRRACACSGPTARRSGARRSSRSRRRAGRTSAPTATGGSSSSSPRHRTDRSPARSRCARRAGASRRPKARSRRRRKGAPSSRSRSRPPGRSPDGSSRRTARPRRTPPSRSATGRCRSRRSSRSPPRAAPRGWSRRRRARACGRGGSPPPTTTGGSRSWTCPPGRTTCSRRHRRRPARPPCARA